MNLYIDKENVLSLIGQYKKPLYEDCIKVIKKQLSVFFNFSKKDVKSDENLMAWMSLLNEGVGLNNEFKFQDEFIFPPRPLTENFHIGFSHAKLSAMYLINDESIALVKRQGALLIAGVGEEITLFNKIFLQRGDYDFHKELRIGGPDFRRWTDVSKYAMPLTDIIFVDSFILTDASLIESNLTKYLPILTTHARTCVNIVLYVNNAHISIQFSELKRLIQEHVSMVTGIAPTVTLVRYTDQRDVESVAEHDRTVLTNYTRIKSGDTYNYFNAAGATISKGREITYVSLAKRDNHDLAKLLITELQAKIDHIKQNPDRIEGDKACNYLNLK